MPTKPPDNTLGKRTFQMMSRAAESSSIKTARIDSRTVNSTFPVQIEIIVTTTLLSTRNAMTDSLNVFDCVMALDESLLILVSLGASYNHYKNVIKKLYLLEETEI